MAADHSASPQHHDPANSNSALIRVMKLHAAALLTTVATLAIASPAHGSDSGAEPIFTLGVMLAFVGAGSAVLGTTLMAIGATRNSCAYPPGALQAPEQCHATEPTDLGTYLLAGGAIAMGAGLPLLLTGMQLRSQHAAPRITLGPGSLHLSVPF